MTEDPLFQATQALRELTVSEEDGRRTRAAILNQLAQREARPFRPLLWFPIAALLIGSTAFAASQGAFSGLVSALRGSAAESSSAAPPLPARPLKSGTSATGATSATSTPLASPSVQAPDAPLPTPSPSPLVQAPKAPVLSPTNLALPSPTPSPAPTLTIAPRTAPPQATQTPANSPGESEQASAELTTYRAAHTLHFQAHNWSAAASAWTQYLKLAPHGSLAPEARFNRALCWIRTGDTANARAALTPFAQGQEGGYRQAEATRLLAALAKE